MVFQITKHIVNGSPVKGKSTFESVLFAGFSLFWCVQDSEMCAGCLGHVSLCKDEMRGLGW